MKMQKLWIIIFEWNTKSQLYKVLPKIGMKLEGKTFWKEKMNLNLCIRYIVLNILICYITYMNYT
jgi:hypothetical protein